MTWSIGGFLLMQFLGKITPQRISELHKRVADEIDTTFASNFTETLNFEQAMTPSYIAQYNAKKTGEKFLINPSLGA